MYPVLNIPVSVDSLPTFTMPVLEQNQYTVTRDKAATTTTTTSQGKSSAFLMIGYSVNTVCSKPFIQKMPSAVVTANTRNRVPPIKPMTFSDMYFDT
jgi:hypothetical protein